MKRLKTMQDNVIIELNPNVNCFNEVSEIGLKNIIVWEAHFKIGAVKWPSILDRKNTELCFLS